MMSRLLPFVLLIVCSSVDAGQGERAKAMLSLINGERARWGRPPLVFQEQLSAAARNHNLFQARRGGITHQGADGSWPWQRANRAGFDGRANENVGWSGMPGDTAVSLHRAFMQSSGHRDNLLDSGWRKAGIHFCWTPRGTYVCCIFGS